ncbi:MAG: bifunctional salicylyl-CoA 5-hydroxylase/oxidoreductase [Proteobacteria bacterium]|nr:bifunctional salicylyl-CoA 5-hydroxylase/oxidoreductase [Pseudomonadota bacterium]HQR04762.1 bifunctional salicylyl-CoA 5-hydroxylase/oxidoreductase [Rhodocyclaceae bacterium]
MRIACLGGGPAGLFFSILVKAAHPAHEVTLVERNPAHDAFGWGVVLSDQTVDGLAAYDPEIHRTVCRVRRRWQDVCVRFKGESIRAGGHGFSGIGRLQLLQILQTRARELGVRMHFERPVTDPAEFSDHDLIVGADGVGSLTRERGADLFLPEREVGKNRFLWLAAPIRLDTFVFDFRETEWGWFNLHAYPHEADWATCIVEVPEAVWQRGGLDEMSLEQSLDLCSRIFARTLKGARLQANTGHARGSKWLRFTRMRCRRWHHGNRVLLGDAAHAVHFSVGAGTRLALEDAAALARWLHRESDLSAALAGYQSEREPEVLRLQSAARNRQDWFENVARYATFDPLQFSYALLTSSQRLGHENLALRDPAYVRRVNAWVSRNAAQPEGQLPPPMFTPYRLRGMELKNRIVVSPMAMYSSTDGVAGDFHLVHLGARSQGGAGLVMTEMTAPCADGRITPGCTGLWNDVQEAAWRRIVDFVHADDSACIGIQLGHSGPKGSTRRMWEGMDEPLAVGNWPLLAASAVAWGEKNQVPRAMDRNDMDRLRDAFVSATRRAAKAGFDLLELHCAHGYLLSSFLSPLTNRRTDEYGGDLAGRLRYPLEVFIAMRAAWPDERPMGVRISAHDWVPGGNTGDDAVVMAMAFKTAGADLIDVSSGQTTRDARPVYGRMYQTPFADRIRNEAGIATIAVGNIFDPDQVNTIVAAGRADLCALGRPHLADPMWTLHAAASQGYDAQPWPLPYQTGRESWARGFAALPSLPD